MNTQDVAGPEIEFLETKGAAAVVYEGNRVVTFEGNVNAKTAGDVLFAAAVNGWSVKLEPMVPVDDQDTVAAFEATFQVIINRQPVDAVPASVVNRQMESLAIDVIQAGADAMHKAATNHSWAWMTAGITTIEWDRI